MVENQAVDCPICDLTCLGPENLREHHRSEHYGYCRYPGCEEQFDRIEDRYAHVRQYHYVDPPIQDTPE